MSAMKRFRDGLFFQNPVIIQPLSMCLVMVITTTLFNGLSMDLSMLTILTLSNTIITAPCKIALNNIRVACLTMVIAGSVTVVDLCLQAFVPAPFKSLGPFIPLTVVNCTVLGRAEPFAYKNDTGASALDGIFQGLGYTMVLVIVCVVREFLGNGIIMGDLLEIGVRGQLISNLGTAAGIRILLEGILASGMILPVDGFLTLAYVITAMQYILSKPKKGDKKAEEVVR